MNPKERILVIEDDESIRENIADILEYEEYDVFTASDGQEGLRLAGEVHPDLILCDINMPAMDGYEVLEKLREDPERKGLPFVFLTAHGERDEIRRGMELGADDYLAKPFKTADLLGAVETRLEQSRKRQEVTRKQWSQFSDEISTMIPHELKTPLNSLCTLSELLRDDWENMEASEINEYLDLMNESGKRLRKLTENLSLYAHLRSQRDSETNEPTRPKEAEPEELDLILLPIAQSIASHFDRTEDLIQECSPDLPSTSHGALLGKALQELLENAFKYSSPGETVRISLQTESQEMIIRIEDQGEGMTADQIRRVEALVQFDRRRKEQQGFGLGIALAREICNTLQGTLTLESESSQGLIATLRIPE